MRGLVSRRGSSLEVIRNIDTTKTASCRPLLPSFIYRPAIVDCAHASLLFPSDPKNTSLKFQLCCSAVSLERLLRPSEVWSQVLWFLATNAVQQNVT
jgi:hypothetical protein